MVNIRKNIYLEDESIKLIEEIKEEEKLTSIGAVIEFLLANYRQANSSFSLAEIIAELVYQKIKQELNTIRIRTSQTDKNTQILLNMMNDLLMTNELDILHEEAPVRFIDEQPSYLYQRVKQHIQGKIETYQKQAKGD